MRLTRRQCLATLAGGCAMAAFGGCAANESEVDGKASPQIVYRRLPPLAVDGWLNGGPVTREDLAGKVVVLDCFASWCGPCAQIAPLLVQNYLKYRFNSVRFVGLTPEGEADLDDIVQFAKANHIEWPIAYGAGPVLQLLESNGFPHVFVLGRDSVTRWDSQVSTQSLERAIRDALAESTDA